tara:strand:- start:232 stop:708 length:477 start_codon:yes stop_codon:yes gene_type:complete
MTWDQYFMRMLPAVAAKSKDTAFHVGAIIVGPDHEIRTTGYNSFVRGLADIHPERFESPEKYKWIEHAERNAIYNAARMGTALKGCRIYIGANPCMYCARAIVSVGIKEVVYDSDGAFERRERYKGRGDEPYATYVQEQKDIIHMFDECGVNQRGITK